MESAVCTLPVSGVSTIHQVQQLSADNYIQKSVAQELIQNSLNENQRGDIQVLRNLILLTVNSTGVELQKTVDRINTGLSYARECYTSTEKRMESLGDSQKHLKSHGRGFLLMFYLGWDIITLPGKDKLLIAAVKV